MRSSPTWERIWLSCRVCDHAWDDFQPNGVPPDTWIAHVQSYRCPECGSQDLLLRREPLEAE